MNQKFCDIFYLAYILTWETDIVFGLALKDAAIKALQKCIENLFNNRYS